MDTDKILKKLYNDPEFGLLGKTKFKLKVRRLHPEISNKEVEDFVQNQELQQVNTKKPFKGYYKIVANPYSYQIDVFYMKQYKSTNNNFFAFMIYVDILSKKMFVDPIRKNTKGEIIESLTEFISKNKVNKLQGDNEFNINDIKSYLTSKNIKFSFDIAKDDHFSKGNKLGIVDSGVRTIKRLIRNYILSKGSTRYISILQNLVNNYNDTPHTSLENKTPNEVYNNESLQLKIKEVLDAHNRKLNKQIDIDVGDVVRVAIDKNKFDKENIVFSKELYLVSEVIGYKYKVMALDGKEMKRKYKYFELLKIDEKQLENRIDDTADKSSKKRNKQSNKLRKEFGENIDVSASSRKKRKAKRTVVDETTPVGYGAVNQKLDLFED